MSTIIDGIEIFNTTSDGLIANGKAVAAIPTTADRFALGCTILGVDGKVYRNAGTVATPSWQNVDEIATDEIADGAVTLAKMANMATASVIYRKTAAAGAPEVNSLATLKTDLGLTGTNSGDQKVGVGVNESYIRTSDETATVLLTADGDTACIVMVKVDTTFSDGFDGAQPEFSLANDGVDFMADTVLVDATAGTTYYYGIKVADTKAITITAVPAIPSTYYDDENGAITVTIISNPIS
jgi:hypothetical protein